MAPTTPLRRGSRTRKPKAIFEAPVTVKVRKSKRIATHTKKAAVQVAKQILNNRAVITRSVAKTLKKGGEKHVLVHGLGDDSETDSSSSPTSEEEDTETSSSTTSSETDSETEPETEPESSFVTDTEVSECESPESGNNGALAHDYLHFVNGYDLWKRRTSSVDSRIGDGPGYESDDGFVVSDGHEDSTDETGDEDETGSEKSDITRISSTTSVASSTLFIPETQLHPHPATTTLTLQPTHFSHLAPSTLTPAEIAEEISDAITLFSRRCNRGRTPLLLVLGREMMCEEEVLEALAQGRKGGFARGVGLGGDGSVGWCVGGRVK
ncbi:hypothetical protein PTMSG1_06905 [Pyrenophora teres f. maculata]|nr:hypothetical protein PTMSG1_06905 [Pyrenophora teres f. maculata]